MSITVRSVKTMSDRAVFLKLAYEITANTPHTAVTSEGFPDGGAAYLAYADSAPVARCHATLQTGDASIGTIGHFEAHNAPAAATALLHAAAEGLRTRGARRIVGPMNGDTWHRYRFATGPFDAPPFINEPWNPPYYPALWEDAGFTVTETYDSHRVANPAQAAANQAQFHQRCVRQGYTFTPITARNHTDLLPQMHALSCRIFTTNVLYTPVDLPTFMQLYRPARALLRPGLSWLAHAPDGTAVGYVFAYPDYAGAMRAMRGQTNLSARLRFLWGKRLATRVCMKTLGVIPEKRGTGLTAALTYLTYTNCVTLGYRETLMCLMHRDNASHRFSGGTTQPFRSYALYEYCT